VARYLSYSGNSKDVRAAEIQQLHTHGISVVLNVEGTGREVLGGYGGGASQARTVAALARALGAPSYTVIYFSGL
jgi:hypothetical protein